MNKLMLIFTVASISLSASAEELTHLVKRHRLAIKVLNDVRNTIPNQQTTKFLTPQQLQLQINDKLPKKDLEDILIKAADSTWNQIATQLNALVKELKKQKFSPQIAQQLNAALGFAFEKPDLKLAKTILDAGANNFSEAIVWASKHGDNEMCIDIVRKSDQPGATPITKSALNQAMMKVMERKYFIAAKLFFDIGADDFSTAFIIAAKLDEAELSQDILARSLRSGPTTQISRDAWVSALTWAAGRDNTKFLSAHLNAASTFLTNDEMRELIQYAATSGRANAVKTIWPFAPYRDAIVMGAAQFNHVSIMQDYYDDSLSKDFLSRALWVAETYHNNEAAALIKKWQAGSGSKAEPMDLTGL